MNPLTNPVVPALYDRQPATRLGPAHTLSRGGDAYRQLRAAADAHGGRPVVAVDTYPGVEVPLLIQELAVHFDGFEIIDVEQEAAKSTDLIDTLIAGNLTEDRVFGVMSQATLDLFYDEHKVASVSERIRNRSGGVVVVGWGAARTVADPSVLVLADLARWEIQQRYRAGGTNWRSANADEDILRKYKRGFFVEWRAADRHKRTLFDRIDFALDTNRSVTAAGLISGDAFREGLAATVTGPFRVVPFFDPGVWGGQWMKEVCGLDDAADNYAWCFDGVPEENSLLLDLGGELFEMPSIDLILTHPRELLGELTFARFGAEFPIRFDLLDTMGGANLSLQVHPLTDYIRETFAMSYTQDESYYLLDAADDAVVFLGLKTGVDPEQMMSELHAAQRGDSSFPAATFVNVLPAKKHDHFLIPAGTVHCSGADSMVLEISATPFIFTFKMWDWDRTGLDGLPRPIHLDHARANIQWDRDTEWTTENLVDQVRIVGEGEGWTEEITGLHELEFIEVRRHWFTGPVPHDTEGTVNVLNLVEGYEAVVTSPTEAFAPFVVHYAETFIVPAQVGPYVITPHGRGIGQRLGTVKAHVRGTRRKLTHPALDESTGP